MLFFTPLIAKNGNCTYQIGEQKLSISPGSYIEWNITYSHNYKIYYQVNYGSSTYEYKYAAENDIIRFTFIEEGYFNDYYSETEDYPCLVARLDYYFSSTNEWTKIMSPATWLVYNPNDGSYFSPFHWGDFWEKYLLFALPPMVNLALLVQSIYLYNPNSFSDSYDNYYVTTNSVNLTNNEGSYNYMDLRADGIVNKWEYKNNWSEEQISTFYLGQGNLQDSSESIPISTEVFISAVICVICVVIIVNKKRLVIYKPQ